MTRLFKSAAGMGLPSSRYARLGQAHTGDLQKRRYTNQQIAAEDYAHRRTLSRANRGHHDWRNANTAPALALGFLLPNGCLQQIAANRFSTPQDFIAILLQGFVRSFRFNQRSITMTAARVWQWILPARSRQPS